MGSITIAGLDGSRFVCESVAAAGSGFAGSEKEMAWVSAVEVNL